MKKILFVIALLFFSSSIYAKTASEHKKILVSIAPYKEIAEELAGKGAKIVLLVPAGVSFHSYEPNARQLQEAASSSVWFRIGDPFEEKAKHVLEEYNDQMVVADLREGLPLLTDNGCAHAHQEEDHAPEHHDASMYDPHIWMSARLMKSQVITMRDALIKAYPEEKELFISRAEQLIQKLQSLDAYISTLFQKEKGGHIFVSHPAYGYFCRDYGLEEISLEQEGKDPGPKQVTELLKQARKERIKAIFVQPQHSTKAATLFAKLLGIELVMLNPYSEHYFTNMKEVAQAFHEALVQEAS